MRHDTESLAEVMDHRQLDFDKPEAGAETKKGQPGAKRYKNRRWVGSRTCLPESHGGFRYIFDHVFQQQASQEAVFERTGKPLLQGVLDGYNATVFAYGVSHCSALNTA